MREIDLKQFDLASLANEMHSRGGALCFKARGSSMYPFIRDGDILAIQPVKINDLRTGDILSFQSTAQKLVAHRLIQKHFKKGDIKKIPQEIMQLPKENIRYLLRALFDGDGTVVNEKRNGCRVSLSTQNRQLAEQVSDLLLRFEIQSSIFRDNKGNVWLVDISGQENFILRIIF